MFRLRLLCAVALGCIFAAEAHARSSPGHLDANSTAHASKNRIMDFQHNNVASHHQYDLLQSSVTDRPLESLRFVLHFAVSQVPVIGGALGTLVHIFFPRDARTRQPLPNIWEKVRHQVQEAIDVSILEAKMDDLTADFQHVEEVMHNYQAYVDGFNFTENPINSEAGIQLSLVMDACGNLMRKLNHEKDRQHLIMLALPTAIVHLTALKERFDFGASLYTGGEKHVWQTELEDHIVEYSSQLETSMNAWTEWRLETIKTCKRAESGYKVKCGGLVKCDAYKVHASVTDTLVSSWATRDCNGNNAGETFWKYVRDPPTTSQNIPNLKNQEMLQKRVDYHKEVDAEFRRQMSARNDFHLLSTKTPALVHGGAYEHEMNDTIVFPYPIVNAWEDCQELCVQEAECVSWTWTNAQGELPGACSMARRSGEFVMSRFLTTCRREECFDDGEPEVITATGLYEYGYQSEDVIREYEDVDTWMACQTLCINSPACTTWTWRGDDVSEFGRHRLSCTLASAPGDFVESDSAYFCPDKMCRATNDLHFAMDGCPSLGQSVLPECIAAADGVAGIRCCSPDGASCNSYCTQDNAWYQAGSPEPSATLVSFDEASAFCVAQGQRLCSPDELDDVCCGTGCGGNDHHVWTLDTSYSCE